MLRTSGTASRPHLFGTTPRGMAEIVGEDQRMGAPEVSFGCRCARPSRSGASLASGFTSRRDGCQRVSALRIRQGVGGAKLKGKGRPRGASPRSLPPKAGRYLRRLVQILLYISSTSFEQGGTNSGVGPPAGILISGDWAKSAGRNLFAPSMPLS